MNLACLFFGHRWQAQRCKRCDAWRNMPAKHHQGHTYNLKVWPEYFFAIVAQGKRFEVRLADRTYQVGDRMVLSEWDPIDQAYTGHSCTCTITYILPGGQHGIAEGYAVLGFRLHTVSHNCNTSPYLHVLSHT